MHHHANVVVNILLFQYGFVKFVHSLMGFQLISLARLSYNRRCNLCVAGGLLVMNLFGFVFKLVLHLALSAMESVHAATAVLLTPHPSWELDKMK